MTTQPPTPDRLEANLPPIMKERGKFLIVGRNKKPLWPNFGWQQYDKAYSFDDAIRHWRSDQSGLSYSLAIVMHFPFACLDFDALSRLQGTSDVAADDLDDIRALRRFVVEKFQPHTYVETSASGSGGHIFMLEDGEPIHARHTGPKFLKNNCRIDFFDANHLHYVMLTGDIVPGSPRTLATVSESLHALMNNHGSIAPERAPVTCGLPTAILADDEVLALLAAKREASWLYLQSRCPLNFSDVGLNIVFDLTKIVSDDDQIFRIMARSNLARYSEPNKQPRDEKLRNLFRSWVEIARNSNTIVITAESRPHYAPPHVRAALGLQANPDIRI